MSLYAAKRAEAERQQFFTEFEQGLNGADIIPGANLASSLTRAGYGIFQIVTGIFFAAVYGFRGLLDRDDDRQKTFNYQSDTNLYYAAHGVANVGRSFVAAVPLLSSLLLGIYDLALEKRFKYKDVQNEKTMSQVWGLA